jgi:uncharacterized protein YjiS (DUF1127 family)
MRGLHAGNAPSPASRNFANRLPDAQPGQFPGTAKLRSFIMAFFTQSRPVADGVFGGVSGLSFTNAWSRLIAWNDRRTTRNELMKLSDRELEDIGLCRADIYDVVARMS